MASPLQFGAGFGGSGGATAGVAASPSFANFNLEPAKRGLLARAESSAVVPCALADVWEVLRKFTWPARVLPQLVKEAEMEADARPTEVGAVRTLTWHSGEWQRQRLLELSDLTHSTTWEVEASSSPLEASAQQSSLRLMRVTEDNFCFIQMITEFSSDASADLVTWQSKAQDQTLQEIIEYFDSVRDDTPVTPPSVPSVPIGGA